jgi:two-component system, LuxR family, response regulator FixJ
MIFIIDDDEPTRDSLQSLLEAHGFETREFADGRTFLDGERSTDDDCLILDLTMPGMNGFEVLAELRRRGDSVPVIIVTAHADPATRSRAAACGALAVLEKPYRASELLALVRRALGIRP